MRQLQTNLFRSIEELTTQPLVVAYGLGVDSTAALVELYKRGIRPDAILFADTGNEKKETYDYLPIINSWLFLIGFPQVTVVKYEPKQFKNFPPYHTLGENCLTNATLPSLAFGFKSCSLKWKVAPQNKWTEQWLPAVDCWKSGGKVKKLIGYDASPKDMKRYADAQKIEDDRYEYWYPLVEWKMDREACKETIRSVGLPVPPKSACIFCPATQPEELMLHRREYLRLIVLMEARARPRLQGLMNEDELKVDFQNRMDVWKIKLAKSSEKKREKLLEKRPKLKKLGTGCSGLWRKATRKRPAMMTDFIRNNGLLAESEIAFLQQQATTILAKRQLDFINGEEILNWHDLLEMFTPEDAVDENSYHCSF